MGLSIDKVMSYLSYLLSALLTAIGLMSLTQWATVIGVVLYVMTYRLNRYHKRRLLEEESKRTDILREMAGRAGSHDLPDVVSAIEELTRLEKRSDAE